MTVSTITNTLTAADGTTPLEGVPVIVRLCPVGGFITASGVEMAREWRTVTNSSGVWSLSLQRNSDITPSNTFYEVTENIPGAYGGPRRNNIQVGSSNQTLYAALISTPPSVPVATYLTQAAADARYVLSPGSFSATTADSRPNDAATAGVASSYARGDHVHERETTYGTAATRAALTGTDLYEGLTFRETDSTDLLYTYRAAAWLQVRESFVVANAAARTAITTPYEGMTVLEADTDLEYTYTGSAWVITNTHGAWIAYTPSWTNLTVGNATNVGKYARTGRTIHWRVKLTWGNTTSATASGFLVSLPVAPHADYTVNHPIGWGDAHDVGVARYGFIAELSSGSLAHLMRTSTDAAVNNTVPFTWATGDQVMIQGMYEAAA